MMLNKVNSARDVLVYWQVVPKNIHQPLLPAFSISVLWLNMNFHSLCLLITSGVMKREDWQLRGFELTQAFGLTLADFFFNCSVSLHFVLQFISKSCDWRAFCVPSNVCNFQWSHLLMRPSSDTKFSLFSSDVRVDHKSVFTAGPLCRLHSMPTSRHETEASKLARHEDTNRKRSACGTKAPNKSATFHIWYNWLAFDIVDSADSVDLLGAV